MLTTFLYYMYMSVYDKTLWHIHKNKYFNIKCTLTLINNDVGCKLQQIQELGNTHLTGDWINILS